MVATMVRVIEAGPWYSIDDYPADKSFTDSISLSPMARELGIHRDTVRRYTDAESPPTRGIPATPPAPASDSIAD